MAAIIPYPKYLAMRPTCTWTALSYETLSPCLKDPKARSARFWYNFTRINSAVRMSPAMACGLEQRLWDIGDIVKLIAEWEMATA